MLDQVRDTLNRIKAPDGQGLVDAGYVQGLVEDKGLIRLVLEAPADRASALVPLKQAVEEALKAMDGVTATQIITTTQTSSKPAAQPAPAAPDTSPDPHTASPDAFRDMVLEIVREEVRTRIGPRISEIIRKVVREELAREQDMKS